MTARPITEDFAGYVQRAFDDEMLDPESGAALSDCQRYRFMLWRWWGLDDAGGLMTFVMLNPSTADASLNDPTIRKCIGFAQRARVSGIRVVNLFPTRSTDPRGLLPVQCHSLDLNDLFLRRATQPTAKDTTNTVVCAWGSPSSLAVRKMVRARAHEVLRLLGGAPLYCLGRSKDGSPRHPLMLSYSQPLESFALPAESESAHV